MRRGPCRSCGKASMPSEPGGSVLVGYAPEFKRNLRRLAKKYRRIKSDLQPLLESLEAGERPGDQIPRSQFTVFKVRVRNSDARRDKRGGYRVIYLVEPPHNLTLLTVYSKSKQGDISVQQIGKIIEELERAS